MRLFPTQASRYPLLKTSIITNAADVLGTDDVQYYWDDVNLFTHNYEIKIN